MQALNPRGVFVVGANEQCWMASLQVPRNVRDGPFGEAHSVEPPIHFVHLALQFSNFITHFLICVQQDVCDVQSLGDPIRQLFTPSLLLVFYKVASIASEYPQPATLERDTLPQPPNQWCEIGRGGHALNVDWAKSIGRPPNLLQTAHDHNGNVSDAQREPANHEASYPPKCHFSHRHMQLRFRRQILVNATQKRGSVGWGVSSTVSRKRSTKRARKQRVVEKYN